MMLLDQPTPTHAGGTVAFTAVLPAKTAGDRLAIEDSVRAWVRKKKTEIMKDFAVIETYGDDASYATRILVQGPPNFEAHKALGGLGFRLDSTKGQTVYKLPLQSHWKEAAQRAAFERALRAAVSLPLPLSRCREVAKQFAQCFTDAFNVALDYSSGSLAAVSQALIQQEHAGLSPVVYLPSTVVAAGCYLGEVLIRELTGCAWMEREDENRCNFTLGPARLNPWLRVLDMCVRGTEATLTGCLDETVKLYLQDSSGIRRAS